MYMYMCVTQQYVGALMFHIHGHTQGGSMGLKDPLPKTRNYTYFVMLPECSLILKLDLLHALCPSFNLLGIIDTLLIRGQTVASQLGVPPPPLTGPRVIIGSALPFNVEANMNSQCTSGVVGG